MENTPYNVPDVYLAKKRVMEKLGILPKEKKSGSSSYGFQYRGAEDLFNAINPLLVVCDLNISQVEETMSYEYHERGTRTVEVNKSTGEVLQTTSKIYLCITGQVTFRFTSLKDGSSFDVKYSAEAMDDQDKASRKFSTFAWKTMLEKEFMIPTEDLAKDDQEGRLDYDPASKTKPVAQQKSPAAHNVKSSVILVNSPEFQALRQKGIEAVKAKDTPEEHKFAITTALGRIKQDNVTQITREEFAALEAIVSGNQA